MLINLIDKEAVFPKTCLIFFMLSCKNKQKVSGIYEHFDSDINFFICKRI